MFHAESNWPRISAAASFRENIMSRQMEESGLNFFMLPDEDKEHYELHVGNRATSFCLLVYKVALLCDRFQVTKKYAAYLSDHANVQIDRGVYAQGQVKIDAAHLCNTSFDSDRFITDARPKSNALTMYCRELRTLSGATLPQTKYDNVGPDKVIDSFQTMFKNEYLQCWQTDPGFDRSPENLWELYVVLLNKTLLQSTSKSFTDITSNGYAGAQKAQAKMASLANGKMDWALGEDFRACAVEIGNL